VDLDAVDAIGLAERVRLGEVTAREVLEATRARVEALDPLVHAVASTRWDAAEHEAADRTGGVFCGLPLLLKDLGATVTGEPSTGGFRQLRDVPATSTSFVAAAFEAAGVVRIGRSTVPELASSPTTEPSGAPPVRNPWHLDHSAGGSSGGAAAAVASGMVALAHGSDGGGSIRIPAGACGLVGLKATRGRISAGPAAGESWAGVATDGVLTRSVRDTAAALDALSGWHPGEPYYAPPTVQTFLTACRRPPRRIRIGFTTAVFDGGLPCHADVVATVHETVRTLELLGHEVAEAHPPALFDPEFEARFDDLVAAEAASTLADVERTIGRAVDPVELEPLNAELWSRGRALSVERYLDSRRWLQLWSRRMAPWFLDFDLLVTPTVVAPPPRIGWFSEAGPAEERRRIERHHPYSGQFNVTGQPAISLPVGMTSTAPFLPIGVQLAAAYGADALLLGVAAELERALPWAARRPVPTTPDEEL
jgi:amidase